jgi:hypothetical protein
METRIVAVESALSNAASLEEVSMAYARSTILSLAAAALVAGCASMHHDAGWQTLIDGNRGMENMVSLGGANWHAVADGIVADKRPDNLPTHYLATKQAYKDFQVRAEFWVSDDANSGIYVRCGDTRPMTDRTCHEANIFEQRPDPTYATGAIVWLAKGPMPIPKTGGKWNTMEVTARGTHMEVWVNGVKTSETNEARDQAGIIGLQYAGGTVKFRKLQIRPL